MVAPAELTWDIAPPRRPSLGDVGDAALVDHATEPPIPPQQPYAAQLNQWALQIMQLAGICPVARFSVQFTGLGPGIVQFITMPTGVDLSTFTVTANGAGDTTISWPANIFPTSALAPTVSLNNGTAFRAPTAVMEGDGVRVKTWNSAGNATDANFTVSVF